MWTAVVHKQRLNNQILYLFRFLLIHSVRKTVLLGFTADLYPNLFLRLQIDPVFVDAGYKQLMGKRLSTSLDL